MTKSDIERAAHATHKSQHDNAFAIRAKGRRVTAAFARDEAVRRVNTAIKKP